MNKLSFRFENLFSELKAIFNSRFIIRSGCNKYYTDSFIFVPDGIVFVDSVSGEKIKIYRYFVIDDRKGNFEND